MPLGLIKDEMMCEPIAVFKYQSLSRLTKIYSCENIPQVGSLTLEMVLKKKKDLIQSAGISYQPLEEVVI